MRSVFSLLLSLLILMAGIPNSASAYHDSQTHVRAEGGGVGQGNGFTTFSSPALGVSFSYPRPWGLHESFDHRLVRVDNASLASPGQRASHIELSLSYDLFQQPVRSTEDIKEILTKKWPDRKWNYVAFRTGPTGYAWQGRGADQAYLGEYYLLDPKHRVLKISYESYEDLNGTESIKGIVASLAVSDQINCDYSVLDGTGRALFQGTDHLISERSFDMDYTESRAPDGLIHVTSTKGAVAASHVFSIGGRRLNIEYDLSYRLALVNYIDHAAIYHAQATCFGLAVRFDGQTVSDDCEPGGDDPRHWADRESTSFLLGAPELNFRWITGKNLRTQTFGTVQVTCREGTEQLPMPGQTIPQLSYAYRNPDLDRGRIVELQGKGADAPTLASMCGLSGEKCQCGFYPTSNFDFDPPVSTENRLDLTTNRFFCAIPDGLEPTAFRYVVLSVKGGFPSGSSSMTFVATVPARPFDFHLNELARKAPVFKTTSGKINR